jgi:hypothetical protein
MQKPVLILVICLIPFLSFGQSYYYTSDHIVNSYVERLDIKYGSETFHSSLRQYTRKEVADLLVNSKEEASFNESNFITRYLVNDNIDLFRILESQTKSQGGEGTNDTSVFTSYDGKHNNQDPFVLPIGSKGIFSTFYKSPAHFYSVNEDNFKMVVNPVINLSFGSESDNDNLIFQNTRAVEIRGEVDEKMYFFTAIYENQADFNAYHINLINKFRSIPGQGLYKDYSSGIIDKLDGYDFLNAKAYLGFNLSESIAIEMGHNNHFIGNGYRSLLMSDYSNNYFYLKFMVNVWKFNYQSIIAELAAVSSRFQPGGDQLIAKKYMATHYLSFKPSKSLEVGLFETVVFSREDQFELQYLNPIILYRTVEQFIGSPDNAMLGLNLKWNIAAKYQLYHQTLVDEFKLSEITSGNGWWANKFGFQFGVKAIDFLGVQNLDVQAEYNVVRPYTYAHRDTLDIPAQFNVASYGHYLQPLAHPIGGNFKEIVLSVNYQPTKKWIINSRMIRSKYGEDGAGQNFGTNIFLPLESREMDFGNTVAQGTPVNVSLLAFDLSYMLYHNIFLDAKFLYRKQDSDDSSLNLNTKYFGFGFRVNAFNRKIDY